ncbi:hypothetical protein BV898_16988 [Hypsibius exemplaris]|uniref:LysM domain-containing protein n=1 Tax=Hypsibius exemplaris TaxID=2072580 RepID=A0A9X6RMD0_HYPEX|nr:hypothetical protein BV898_16988 [Hypsibius exemplaris]
MNPTHLLALFLSVVLGIVTVAWYNVLDLRRWASGSARRDIYPLRFPGPDSPQEEAFVINPLGQGRDFLAPPEGRKRGQSPCYAGNTRENNNCAEIATGFQIYNIRRLLEMNPHLNCDDIVPGATQILVRADAGCGSPCYREWC